MGNLTDVAIRARIKAAGERSEGRTDDDGPLLSWRPDRTAPHLRLRYRFAGKPRVMEIGRQLLGSHSCRRAPSREGAARQDRPRPRRGRREAGAQVHRAGPHRGRAQRHRRRPAGRRILRAHDQRALEAPEHRAQPHREGHQAAPGQADALCGGAAAQVVLRGAAAGYLVASWPITSLYRPSPMFGMNICHTGCTRSRMRPCSASVTSLTCMPLAAIAACADFACSRATPRW